MNTVTVSKPPMLVDAPKHSRRLHIFLALSIYYISLVFAYNYFMLAQWGQDSTETSWGNGARTTGAFYITTLIFAIGAWIVANLGRRPSDFMHLLLFCTPIAPMCVLAGSKGVGLTFVFVSVVALWVSVFVSKLSFRFPRIKTRFGIFSQIIYLRFCIFLGLFIISLTIFKGGLKFINLDFSEVYSFRRGASASRGILLNYLLLNYIGILLALGFSISFSKKAWGYSAGLLAINIVIFALTSSKAYLFVGLLTLCFYILLGSPRAKVFAVTSFAFIMFSLTILYIVYPQYWIWPTLFVRRFFFVPAYINMVYWEFFSEHAFSLWADSKIGLGIAISKYGGEPIPQVIGFYMTGKDFSNTEQLFHNANTGWLGSGFANAGYVGMIIYAILSGFVTKLANSLGDLIGNRAAISGLSFYFFTIFFTSTDLPAALLSYGIFSLVLVMLTWKKPRSGAPQKNYVGDV